MNTRDTTTLVVKLQGVNEFVRDTHTVNRSVDSMKRTQAEAVAKMSAADKALWADMNARGRAAAVAGSKGGASTAAAAGLTARQRAVVGAGGGGRLLGLATPFGGVGALLGIGAGYAALNQFGASMRHQGLVQQLNAQTAAGIKSTGGAANVSAEHVSKLASSWSRLAGVQDETVQEAENVLLTFAKVRNEAGKGNAIFDRTTEAVANVAARMGTDMPTAALQLGKALNDPINGFTALRRIGIQFTNSQIDQIKVLTAAGDVAGAQKIILQELNTEFGGSARAAGKTLPASLVRLSEAWEDSRDKLTYRLMPQAIRFTDWLTKTLPGAVDVAITAMGAFSTGHDNTIEKWLRRQPGGGVLGDVFHYGNTHGLRDTLNDALPGYLKPRNTKAQFDAGLRVSRMLDKGKFGPDAADDLTTLFGSKDKAEAYADKLRSANRGMGDPFPEKRVKVNWDAGDVFQPQQVILVADNQQIAKVVNKAQQKSAHAQGRKGG